MWASKDKRSYQRIDDDFDDSDVRSSMIPQQSIHPLSSRPPRFFGANDAEANPLIGRGSNNVGDTFTSPPNSHSIDEPQSRQSMRSSHTERSWDHITDLDQFFTRVYEYHQGGGFTCIALKSILSLLQFIFIVVFSTFFLQCIDYDVLFNNKTTNTKNVTIIGKRHFSDAVVQNCAAHLHPLIVLSILIAIVFWCSRVIKTAYILLQLKEIQQFYNSALKMTDAQLGQLSWHCVVTRICEVQPKLNLMIHHEHLSSIDLYHRILRFKNYFVALVNKRLLPPLLNVPVLGEVMYLPNGLKTNLEWLLFWGFRSPWSGPYQLKEEYKQAQNLDHLAMEMEQTILYMGIANLALFPLIFLYQILYSFFTLSELYKRDPGSLGVRRFSNYGRYRLRHFNELEHELKARLNRSHPFANAYLNQFFSPLAEVAAKHAGFIAGAIFGVLAILTAWDEDVLAVEHVLTVMTVCGVAVMVARSLIPDEHLVYQHEQLLSRVSAELHYTPVEWRGAARSDRVRTELEQLFQLRSLHLLEELSSPLLTPFVLLFYIRPQCRDLVQFLHDYTERVGGLGDVCSFALMDTARHGDPNWDVDGTTRNDASADCALDGKTELSVLHFASANPEWRPPPASANFIQRVRNKMECDTEALRSGSAGAEENALAQSVLQLHSLGGASSIPPAVRNSLGLAGSQLTPLDASLNLHSNNPLHDSIMRQSIVEDPAAADMRMQALFVRELRRSQIASRNEGYGSLRNQELADLSTAGSGIAPATQSVFGVPQLSMMGMGESAMPESMAGHGGYQAGSSGYQASHYQGGPSMGASVAGPSTHGMGGLAPLAPLPTQKEDDGEEEDEDAPPNLFQSV